MTQPIVLSERSYWPHSRKVKIVFYVFVIIFFGVIQVLWGILFGLGLLLKEIGYGARVKIFLENGRLEKTQRFLFIDLPFGKVNYKREDFEEVIISKYSALYMGKNVYGAPTSSGHKEVKMVMVSPKDDFSFALPSSKNYNRYRKIAKQIRSQWGYTITDLHQKELARNREIRRKREATGRR